MGRKKKAGKLNKEERQNLIENVINAREERRKRKRQGIPMTVKQLTQERKGGSRKSRCNHHSINTKDSDQRWALVTVTSQEQVEKSFLYKTLSEYLDNFCPYAFENRSRGPCFYLENPGDLSALETLSGRLLDEKNRPMRFSVQRISIPIVEFDKKSSELLKKVVMKRYNSSDNHLDLSCFYKDSSFLEEDVLLPIINPKVCSEIVSILTSDVLEISSLSLGGNMICCGRSIVSLIPIFHEYNINKLCLKDNYLDSIVPFKMFETTSITEINLLGNPIANKVSYKQSVYALFPNIKIIREKSCKSDIDNIQFDSLSLSGVSKPNVSREKINEYIKQYYVALDSNRSFLKYAYTEDIKFEFVCKNSVFPCGNCNGQEELQHFHSNFPETTHNTDSFVITYLEECAEKSSVQIDGQFQIKAVTGNLNFSNKMMLLPHNEGLCCSVQLTEIF